MSLEKSLRGWHERQTSGHLWSELFSGTAQRRRPRPTVRPVLERLEVRELLSGATITTERLREAYGQIPLNFEANQGQTDAQVQFLSRGDGYALFLTPSEAVLSLRKPAASSAGTAVDGQDSADAVLRMRVVGGNPSPRVVGVNELAGKVNYFRGSESTQWRTNVPTFARAEYQQVYPGIDLVYYGNQRQLEYDFIVAPGVSPNVIMLGFQGAEGMRLDAQGNLILQTAGGDLVHHAPVIYQDSAGVKQAVVGRYVLKDSYQVGFEVGAYDASKPLIIDPILGYSTYLGTNDTDLSRAIAVDAVGNAYVTGSTGSIIFPTTDGAFQRSHGGGTSDVFVTKLNATGSAMVYSTYLGGITDDFGSGIAVDTAGNAYVTGYTSSSNFPTTVGAFQRILRGVDAFVTKVNPTGSALVYSTFLGGTGIDQGLGIAVDSTGSAYVTGETRAADFPTTAGSFQSVRPGGSPAFVTKLNPTGSALAYSSYLGGSGDYSSDSGRGIAVDAVGNAYVTGSTGSSNFLTTPGALQRTIGGQIDAFVTKVNASGSALIYSSYLGRSNWDLGQAIAVDSAGNAYLTGYTRSINFPITPGAFQPLLAGNEDIFVTKVNATGSGLVYSTFLGGTSTDEGRGIAVDAAGNAYVTGITSSGDIPTTPGTFQTIWGGGNSDAFITKLNVSGSALAYSTYLGGTGHDYGLGIAVDAAGNGYVAGYTGSTNFPTVNPLQPVYGGNTDAFVAKVNATGPLSHFSVVTPSNTEVGTTFTIIVTARDTNDHTYQDYRGTVRFTSSDGAATLPGNYAFTAADRGQRTFTITLRTPGPQTITVTDTITGSLTASVSVTVIPAAARTLTVTGFPSPVMAGAEASFTVTLRDAFGNLATGYRGTVRFTSSDAQAALPGNYTFTAADGGMRTFRATLRTVGNRSLTATDTGMPNLTGTQTGIVVNHAAVSTFLVTGFPSPIVAGTLSTFTVTAKDSYGNTVPSYTGTVRFSSTDRQAVLPSNYTFRISDEGTRTFGAELKTAGIRSLTATDTVTSSITGAQTGIVVTPAAASRLAVTGFPSPTTAGNVETFTVMAQDRFGNTATGYRGTVRLSSSDGQAELPGNYSFGPIDQGIRTFAAILKTAGTQSLTATDVVTGTITGTQVGIVVNPAAADHLTVDAPADAVAGTAFSITVAARDPFNNVAPDYRGTVTFTSTDPQATLPKDYTFTAADNGSRTFEGLTFRTAGSQTLTARDTVNDQFTAIATTLVIPGPVAYYSLDPASGIVVAGQPFDLYVYPFDEFGNHITDYTGEIAFLSTDEAAVLPKPYTFRPEDGGLAYFFQGVTLNTQGSQELYVLDTATYTAVGYGLYDVQGAGGAPGSGSGGNPLAADLVAALMATERRAVPEAFSRLAETLEAEQGKQSAG